MTREEHGRLLAFATGRTIQERPTAPIGVSAEDWADLLADVCCVDAAVTSNGGLVIRRPNWSYAAHGMVIGGALIFYTDNCPVAEKRLRYLQRRFAGNKSLTEAYHRKF